MRAIRETGCHHDAGVLIHRAQHKRFAGRVLSDGCDCAYLCDIAVLPSHQGKGLGKEIEPEVVEQYRAGDIRHCYADARLAEELLGFRSEIAFADGMRDLLVWLEGQEAVDAVDTAREALLARGLAR